MSNIAAFFPCLGVSAVAAPFHKPSFSVSKALEGSFKHGLPWVFVGTTYGVGTSLAAQIRNKDGPLNHAVGGYAAGTILGSWYKSTKMGIWTGLLFASLGAGYKAMVDNDVVPRGGIRRQRAFNMYRRGWLTDRPHAEGVQDENSDDSFKLYRPEL